MNGFSKTLTMRECNMLIGFDKLIRLIEGFQA